MGVGLLLSLMLNAFVTPLYPNLSTSDTYVRPDVFSISRATRISTPPPKPTPPPSHRGRLVDAKIYRSSNNAAIDDVALRAARGTRYAPRIANCVPVEGTYLFHADFEPN